MKRAEKEKDQTLSRREEKRRNREKEREKRGFDIEYKIPKGYRQNGMKVENEAEICLKPNDRAGGKKGSSEANRIW